MTERVVKTGIGSEWDAAMLTGYFGLANAFGRVLIGYLGDLFDERCRLWLYVGDIIILGVVICLSIFATNYVTMAVFLVTFGIFEGGYVTVYSVIMSDLFGVKKMANVFGIVSLFDGIASMLGPPIIGLTVDEERNSYDVGIFICGLFTLLSGVMQVFLPGFPKFEDREGEVKVGEEELILK
jgi:MFS family permease